MIFQAAFRLWASGSRPQLLRGFPFPHGYPPASSSRSTADERRSPTSLSSISLARANRPYRGKSVSRPGDITDVVLNQLFNFQSHAPENPAAMTTASTFAVCTFRHISGRPARISKLIDTPIPVLWTGPGGARTLVCGSSGRRRPTPASVPASQLPAHVGSMQARKKPLSPMTPGIADPLRNCSSVTCAHVVRTARSYVHRRRTRGLFVRNQNLM